MIRCEDCGARFGGAFTFRRHRPITWDRCRGPEEMREVGLHRNRRHVWVRRRYRGALTLFDFRSSDYSLTRRLYGRPYRALSVQERREYRAVLRALAPAPREAGDACRNAQGISQGAA